MCQRIFVDQVFGTSEGRGSIAKTMLINFSLAGERLKLKYRQRLAQLRTFAPQTAALCELLATKGHWAVQLRTKVKEFTKDSRPQHQDGEIPQKTTHSARFKSDEPGVT